MTITRLGPPGLHAVPGLISQVVTVTGRTLIHLSGQVAWDEHGTPVAPGDHAGQAARIARNIDIALAAAGATRADIVKETIYVVAYTPDLLQHILDALRDGHQPSPASTVIGVETLFAPDFLIEVDIVAAVTRPAP
ncbi:enamine deaminase RidA [Actinoplanes philippinensis]|uniref:Enamine deaminase RidA, house cleaning of reactive enamine intermediates, YjgF/YER057c/UK114 family n=1 Tax=Actinoplanes philippinensis TaxID=35752 RepID=A0A1I2KKB0_9ACTN|nr:RidA family protein [Actinoplanes philippinensis]GIE82026.1 enamine deaminase RidA [Actinoplanes philippinensis]SFF65551.1 Enamine deaminase RidA, house cleaning of reactive enamine intermediates, YjgF/YER057c/UK114 family [Actinoplanes philippinensis]